MKLFVAGFPNDFDDTDLKEMFELYGTVASARFVTDRGTGKSKGFGFVDMPDRMEALQTIDALNGVGIKGKKIAVQEATDRPAGGGGGGNFSNNRGGGGFRGRNNDNFNRRY